TVRTLSLLDALPISGSPADGGWEQRNGMGLDRFGPARDWIRSPATITSNEGNVMRPIVLMMLGLAATCTCPAWALDINGKTIGRSEEHTSELQSREK